MVGYDPEIILSGRKLNDNMGFFIFRIIMDRLEELGISANDAKIGVFGLTFKRKLSDFRNNKVFDIINYFEREGSNVLATDPYLSKNYDFKIKSTSLNQMKIWTVLYLQLHITNIRILK